MLSNFLNSVNSSEKQNSNENCSNIPNIPKSNKSRFYVVKELNSISELGCSKIYSDFEKEKSSSSQKNDLLKEIEINIDEMASNKKVNELKDSKDSKIKNSKRKTNKTSFVVSTIKNSRLPKKHNTMTLKSDHIDNSIINLKRKVKINKIQKNKNSLLPSILKTKSSKDKIENKNKKSSSTKKNKSIEKNLFDVSINFKEKYQYPEEYLSTINNYSCYEEFLYKRNVQAQIPHEYLFEIEQNLIDEQINYPFLFGYMKKNTDIHEKMRSILVDWLIEVTFKYKFKQQTIHLTTLLLDWYLSSQKIEKNHLQMVGVSSMLIATKFHEVLIPEISELVYIGDGAFTFQDIVECENKILIACTYSLNLPTSLTFYEIYSYKLFFNQLEINFGMYLLELVLLEYSFLKYKPSTIAQAVAYLTVMKFGKIATTLTNLNKEEIILVEECSSKLANLFQGKNWENIVSFKSLRIKYSSDEFLRVALI